MTVMFEKMKSERGNALFLILIAVALFAALSYAVTQSGRGGGSIDKEQALILASQATQFPASVRTGVTRMVITGSSIGNLIFTEAGGAGTDDVFIAAEGGVIWQDPPANAQTAASDWIYMPAAGATDGWYVLGVGTNTQDTGREVIMAMNNTTLAVCQQINRGLGLTTTIPVEGTVTNMAVAGAAAPAANNAPGDAFTFTSASGQPFSCVKNGAAGVNVYYHVLVEQ